MVQPKESGHFEFYAPGSPIYVLPLRESAIYLEDRLGLKAMDEEGKLVFLTIPGAHIDFDNTWFVNEIIKKYFI